MGAQTTQSLRRIWICHDHILYDYSRLLGDYNTTKYTFCQAVDYCSGRSKAILGFSQRRSFIPSCAITFAIWPFSVTVTAVAAITTSSQGDGAGAAAGGGSGGGGGGAPPHLFLKPHYPGKTLRLEGSSPYQGSIDVRFAHEVVDIVRLDATAVDDAGEMGRL